MSLLKINGVDIQTPSKYTYTYQDISQPDAGRDQNGLMFKGYVCSKVKIELSWNLLTEEEAKILFQSVKNEYFSVTYPDAVSGTTKTGTFYVGDRTAPMYSWFPHLHLYKDVAFNIIER